MSEKPLFEKKNVVVTGGAGFIGSHLCERLLKEARVICIDNFSTSQEANIDALLKNPDFEFIRHDVTQPIDLEAFPELARFKVKFQGIQEIYHLACPTSPRLFEKYKMQTLYANSLGMKNVLDLAVQHQARVFYSSTCVVYGPRDAEGHPFAETHWGTSDVLSPRACYDEGKRFAETMCATYAQVHKIDIRIGRLFRTYGPRMPLFDGQMVPDFITNALDGKDLEIFGTEDFRTSLVYVTDVVDAIMKMMQLLTNVGPVNMGSDMDVKLADVARSIIEMTGSGSKIVYKDPLLFMSQLGLPDLLKAKDKLGWMPLVTLENGLKATIDYTIAHKSLLGFGSFAARA